jgi:hypothetical protein
MINEDRVAQPQVGSQLTATADRPRCDYVRLVAKTFNNQDGQPYMVSVREHCRDAVTDASRGRCDRHARCVQKAC